MIIACRKGDVSAVRALIENGASVNEEYGRRNQLPVHVAAKGGHTSVLRCLVEHGVSVELPCRPCCDDPKCPGNFAGACALHLAVRSGVLEAVRFLAGCVKDVDMEGPDGHSAVFFAAGSGNLPMVTYKKSSTVLLFYVCDVKSFRNSFPKVRCLLEEFQAKVHCPGQRTPSMFAAEQGHVEVLRYLAAMGDNVNFSSDHGVTALILAAQKGQLAAVTCLATELGGRFESERCRWA
jgi:ankyrin repeat protein